MLNKIISDEYQNYKIKNSEYYVVIKEISKVITELKELKYDKWFELDSMIGEVISIVQHDVFKYGFIKGIELSNEVENIKNNNSNN